jgi:hypothetical protein
MTMAIKFTMACHKGVANSTIMANASACTAGVIIPAKANHVVCN